MTEKTSAEIDALADKLAERLRQDNKKTPEGRAEWVTLIQKNPERFFRLLDSGEVPKDAFRTEEEGR